MICCNNRDIEEHTRSPEDFEPCCGRIRGRRCLCLPYDDAYLITAQILTIAAFGISWVFWGTSVLSFIGMVLFQLPWCLRHNKAALYGAVASAAVASLASVVVGVYCLVSLGNYSNCELFSLKAWGINDHWYEDRCREEYLAATSFGCALLWFAAGCLMMEFVSHGRHAVWEGKYRKAASDEQGKVASVDLLV